MVSGYVFLIFFVILLYYACSNENTQLAATGSAIRQIWSRGCGLSCRPTGLSGLSGLANPPCQVGPSHEDCVCDTCPCAMIEKLRRTCSPAARLYTNVCNTLSFWYESIKKSTVEMYEYATRVLECGTACQRQEQIIATNDYGSEENFNFGGNVRTKQSVEQKPETTGKVLKFVRSAVDLSKSLIKKKSSITFKEPPKSECSSEGNGSDEGKSSGIGESASKCSGESILKSNSTETLKPTGSSSYCSKCIEEGKVCMNKCPRAKKP